MFGTISLLASPTKGILLISPVPVFAFAGWPSLLARREDPWRAVAAAFLFFGLMAAWFYWWGGWCYGARLVVPVIPFLAAGIVEMPVTKPRTRRIFDVLLVASVTFQVLAIVRYWKVWDHHPLQLIWQRLQRPAARRDGCPNDTRAAVEHCALAGGMASDTIPRALALRPRGGQVPRVSSCLDAIVPPHFCATTRARPSARGAHQGESRPYGICAK